MRIHKLLTDFVGNYGTRKRRFKRVKNLNGYIDSFYRRFNGLLLV